MVVLGRRSCLQVCSAAIWRTERSGGEGQRDGQRGAADRAPSYEYDERDESNIIPRREASCIIDPSPISLFRPSVLPRIASRNSCTARSFILNEERSQNSAPNEEQHSRENPVGKNSPLHFRTGIAEQNRSVVQYLFDFLSRPRRGRARRSWRPRHAVRSSRSLEEITRHS